MSRRSCAVVVVSIVALTGLFATSAGASSVLMACTGVGATATPYSVELGFDASGLATIATDEVGGVAPFMEKVDGAWVLAAGVPDPDANEAVVGLGCASASGAGTGPATLVAGDRGDKVSQIFTVVFTNTYVAAVAPTFTG